MCSTASYTFTSGTYILIWCCLHCKRVTSLATRSCKTSDRHSDKPSSFNTSRYLIIRYGSIQINMNSSLVNKYGKHPPWSASCFPWILLSPSLKTLSRVLDLARPHSYPHSRRNPYRGLDPAGPSLLSPSLWMRFPEHTRGSCFCSLARSPSPFPGSHSNTHTCSPVHTHLSLVNPRM